MTLISTFRAPKQPAGPDGITVCADSQETVTRLDENSQPYELRVAVQKIEPLYKTFDLHLAIAGAGNAPLIDGFIEKVRRQLGKGNDPTTLVGVRKLVEQLLQGYYNNEIKGCPDENNAIKLFVMASCPRAAEYDLWVNEYSVLRTPKYPALIGWDEALYHQTAKRLSSDYMTLAQAILASIYTLTIAKQTSNYVGGELSLAVIGRNGIWMESAEYVAEMENRLKVYEGKVNAVFLACADTSVSVESLQKTIQTFGDDAAILHREQIEKLLAGQTLQQVAGSNDPYPKFPLGSNVIFDINGKVIGIEDPSEKKKLDAYARAMHDLMLKNGLVEYVIRRVGDDDFLVLLSNRWVGMPDKEIGHLNMEGLKQAYEGAPRPFSVDDILTYLQIPGSEVTVYGDPMPSASRTSEGH